jgi:hypothetical protein
LALAIGQGQGQRFLNRVRNAADLGARGVIRWSRDEMHER